MVGLNTENNSEIRNQDMVYIAKFVSRVKKGKQVSGERDEKIERKILNSIQSSWKDYNLDHYIGLAGDSGRYQKLIFLNAIIVLFTAAYTVYTLSYLVPNPEPLCKNNKGEFISCSEKKACGLIDKGEGKIEWGYPNNWTEKFGFYCDKAYMRQLGVTTVLVLSTIFCLALLYLSDIIGRKKVMKIASINIMLGLTIGTFSPYFIPKMIGVGLAAGAEGAFSALFTILINETSLPETRMRSTLIAGCFMAYGVGCIVLNIVTIFVRSADLLAFSATVLLYLACLPSFFTYHETPRFLHKSGLLTRLGRNLTRIGKMNKKKLTEYDFYSEFISKEEFVYIKEKKLDIILEEIEVEISVVRQSQEIKTKKPKSGLQEFFGSFK